MTHRRHPYAIALLTLGAIALACATQPVHAQAPCTVTVAVPDTIPAGKTAQATAAVAACNGTSLSRTVTWSASGRATVTSTGLVTASASTGSGTVTATVDRAIGGHIVTVATVATPTPPVTTAPGAVTTLAVAGVTATSAVLQFEQVGNGAGAPASYDIRFAKGPISWGDAANVASGTCATPVIGNASSGTRSCTVRGLQAKTAYQFQLVPFRGTWGVGSRVYGPLSNVAGATTATDSTVITPPAPVDTTKPPKPPVDTTPQPPVVIPPTDPSSHEPAGFTKLIEGSFSTITENGFQGYDSNGQKIMANTSAYSIVSDATAVKSPPGVGQQLFPKGYGGSGSPATIEKGFGAQRATVYVVYWVKISANWCSHPSGVNKQIYIWSTDGGSTVYTTAQGTGSCTGPLNFEVHDQGTGETKNYGANLGGATFARGAWHKVEIILTANSGGAANGGIDFWVDGQALAHYTNVRFFDKDGIQWNLFQWTPIYGGGSDGNPPADQFQWLDHVYVSGKP